MNISMKVSDRQRQRERQQTPRASMNNGDEDIFYCRSSTFVGVRGSSPLRGRGFGWNSNEINNIELI
jgi:hypothetical protein